MKFSSDTFRKLGEDLFRVPGVFLPSRGPRMRLSVVMAACRAGFRGAAQCGHRRRFLR